MLRRITRILFLILAVLGLLPGVNEALEELAERIEHGHAAHSVPGEPDPLGAEHGCTPVEHHCRCHPRGQSLVIATRLAPGGTFGEWVTWMLNDHSRRLHQENPAFAPGRERLIAMRATAPPTPPPNA